MLCLGLDTALGACSVAWIDDAGRSAREFAPMTMGHAENLAPMAERLMRESGRSFGEVTRLAVTTGPGTFTGQRIGLAFARGLALALQKPCVGVTTLAAMAAAAQAEAPAQPVFVASDARRGEVYAQAFAADGTALGPSALLTTDAAAVHAASLGPCVTLAGTAATAIAALVTDTDIALSTVQQPDALFVARLGAVLDPALHPPVPLYLRAPDAKLPGPLKPVPFARRREA